MRQVIGLLVCSLFLLEIIWIIGKRLSNASRIMSSRYISKSMPSMMGIFLFYRNLNLTASSMSGLRIRFSEEAIVVLSG